MSKKIYKKPNRAPSHAGRILKSGFIEQHDIRIETLASVLGITRQHLSRIINGHNPITSDIAIKLETVTGTPATQWLSIQAKYDTYMLAQDEDYQRYKKTIYNWTSKSLNLNPDDRRTDINTQKWVEEASGLAKNLTSRKPIVI